MNRPQRPLNAPEPNPIDDDNDRMGAVHPLDFDDDSGPDGRAGDDLTPEALIPEDGARSADEPGHGRAADSVLNPREVGEVGAGHGFDEQELAHIKPLDGKPE